MSDKMMAEMKRRLREMMKDKPVGSSNAKEIEDMIVQVGEDTGVFKPKKMRDGGRVSDRDKMKMEKMARPKKTGGESGKVISDADVKKVAAMLEKPKKPKTDRQLMQFQDGGAVPAKFKGFSKLPEKVQQKMNPDFAQKYENGGEVRGARSAISGRGFKGIR